MFYQVKVRLLADAAGVNAISLENKQVVLRFPAQLDSAPARQFPDLGADVRPGKNSLWLPLGSGEDWMERLVALLIVLAGEKA